MWKEQKKKLTDNGRLHWTHFERFQAIRYQKNLSNHRPIQMQNDLGKGTQFFPFYVNQYFLADYSSAYQSRDKNQSNVTLDRSLRAREQSSDFWLVFTHFKIHSRLSFPHLRRRETQIRSTWTAEFSTVQRWVLSVRVGATPRKWYANSQIYYVLPNFFWMFGLLVFW